MHDLTAFLSDEQARIEREVATTGSTMTQARLVARSGVEHLIAMPDLSDQDTRWEVKRVAEQHDGVLVSVVHEAWVVALRNDMDPATWARLERAAAEQTLNEQPERQEIVILYVEGEHDPVRRFNAPILRDRGGVRLGPWEEVELRLPRSTFRRYLVERQGDKEIVQYEGFRIVKERP